MTIAGLTRRQAVAGGLALVAQPARAQTSLPVPRARPLEFLVLGDWGRKGNKVQRTVAAQLTKAACENRPDFVVTTGDNFYDLGVTSTSDPHWTQSFEDVYDHPQLQIPWYPTLGNHDYGGDVCAQIGYSGPQGRWKMQDRWYWRSGEDLGMRGVDLFFIDTVTWTGGESFPFSMFGSPVTRDHQLEQRRWLESRLMLSRAPMKIVFGHYPIYSIGKHGGRMKMWDLDQLLRRAGVSAYVCGHDHCTYHIEAAGMHYVCSGGGAQAVETFTGDIREPFCVLPGDCVDRPDELPRPRWRCYRMQTGFAAVSATPQRATIRLYDGAGDVYHCVELKTPALRSGLGKGA